MLTEQRIYEYKFEIKLVSASGNPQLDWVNKSLKGMFNIVKDNTENPMYLTTLAFFIESSFQDIPGLATVSKTNNVLSNVIKDYARLPKDSENPETFLEEKLKVLENFHKKAKNVGDLQTSIQLYCTNPEIFHADLATRISQLNDTSNLTTRFLFLTFFFINSLNLIPNLKANKKNNSFGKRRLTYQQ